MNTIEQQNYLCHQYQNLFIIHIQNISIKILVVLYYAGLPLSGKTLYLNHVTYQLEFQRLYQGGHVDNASPNDPVCI